MANNNKANFFQGASTRSKQATKGNPLPPWNASPATAPAAPVAPDNRTPPKKTNDQGAGKNIDEDMFEEIRKMSATLQRVAGDVVAIKETTKEQKDSVDNIQERLGEAEQRISDMEDIQAGMEKNIEKCDERLETLWARVEDLENQSRRNNVRMVGLAEGKEETGKVAEYVEKILSEGLGLTGPGFEIERAHRSLAPMPDPDQPPRTIMMCFLRSSVRDKVLQVAREKRGIEWENCKLSFFEDLAKELADKRKAFRMVKKRLHELNVRHRLVYPATLIFT